MSHLRYLPGNPGNYYADRFGLIGHDEADVAAWRADHPDYRGGFWFDYGDGSEDQIDVTEVFECEPEASAWVESIRELVRGETA